MNEPPPAPEPPARGLVVVAEDDRSIADVVTLYLKRDGFGVHVARTGPDALAAVRTLRPVAVVLDIGLPGMDGVEDFRTLRPEEDWTPVLFVTARDDEVDRELGLGLGADGYVTKPFSPRELVARVRAALRRVWCAGREVALTATEFDLLAHLMTSPGRVHRPGVVVRPFSTRTTSGAPSRR